MDGVTWTKNDTLVISDIHIGIKNNQVQKLCAFLDLVLKNPPHRLVVNGDLFELWSTNYKDMDNYDYQVIRKLIKLPEKNVKVVFIPGNHDRAFRAFRKIKIGKIKIQNEYIIHEHKKKYVVVHGDEFDAFTRHHIILSIMIDKMYVGLIKMTSFFKWLFKANFSLYAKRHTSKYNNLVIKIKKAALKYAKSMDMDGIIIGHTHWPEIFTDLDGITYANAGDWLDSCSYVVVGDEIKLEYFK
jgi:UDP-2,3-diacylglucosamine pyrophosphatase LpxH